jgi:hypothetical protein
MAEIMGHSQTKGRATGNPNLGLTHRATSRLYENSYRRGAEAQSRKGVLCFACRFFNLITNEV